MMPMSVTVSITNMCNSRCKTCCVWKIYEDDPALREKELRADEFDSIFESLGEDIMNVVVSGGEPYLRPDLVRICESLYERCHPGIMVIPTNGLLPPLVEDKTKKVLEFCSDSEVIVNLSLDGVGSRHDEIRGIPGNFERVMDSYDRLRRIRNEYCNLKIGIHSVVSRFSIDGLLDLYDYVRDLKPDSYISEYAERRSELFNTDEDIAPDLGEYGAFVRELKTRLRKDYMGKKLSTERMIQAFRLIYYDLAVRELEERRQVIPCYAGFASCQVTPYGDVWPCCVLGYNMSMGNLRQEEYSFSRVWYSKKAEEVRKYIKAGVCTCPLQNAHTTSMLFDLRYAARIIIGMLT